MPLEPKKKLTEAELAFGLVLLNPLLFLKFFWAEELTIPETRLDLPAEWRGKQIIPTEQKMMMLDTSDRVLFCTARKIAKTIILEATIVQASITYTRNAPAEAMIVTPQAHHLSPLRKRVEVKISQVPLFDMMLTDFNKSDGFITWVTGITWWMRIEGISGTGKNMVGPRCIYMLCDEMAFGDQANDEARKQTALPDAKWIMAGVPNGVRDSPFYRLDQTTAGDRWSKHKYPSFINPLYQSDEAHKRLEDDYGGVNTQGYLTQVLGQWGQEAYSSFPKVPYIFTLPFKYIELTEEQINANLMNLAALIQLPTEYVQDAEAWLIGGDLGYSPAPTVLLVCYLKGGVWYELARIKLLRANVLNQARIIDYINTRALPEKCKVITLDAHGFGAGVLQTLHNDPSFTLDDYAAKVVDAGFAGRVEDPRIKIHTKCQNRVRLVGGEWMCDHCHWIVSDPNEIRNGRVPVKQHYTNLLKEAFTFGSLYLDGLEAMRQEAADAKT